LGTKALEGIRVADFSWAVAGPLTSRFLSDFGAQVIKIESMTKVDPLRTGTPFRDKSSINGSAFFANFNRGKYSLGLDLRTREGVEFAKKVISICDVVVENYTPGVMDQWGLGYEDLKNLRPDIIMFSTSQQGQSGPLARHPALGNSLVSLAGFTHVTGWADRPPTGPYGAYPDYTSPPLGAALIAAALAYRKRTGKGQHIDQAQYEANLHLLAPMLLDCSVNQRTQGRDGNRCSHAAPHGVYRCSGNDRWCAITVFTDEEWKSLCKAMGDPQWAGDTKFRTVLGRKRNEAELDAHLENWTIHRSAEQVMNLLQAAGVPAGMAQTTEDLRKDPQLKYREHYLMLDHSEIGGLAHDAPPFRLSRTPAVIERSAPRLGEHNEYVCHDLVGISDEEFVELLGKGVLQQP